MQVSIGTGKQSQPGTTAKVNSNQVRRNGNACLEKTLNGVVSGGVQVPLAPGAKDHSRRHVSLPEGHRLPDYNVVDAKFPGLGHHSEAERSSGDTKKSGVLADLNPRLMLTRLDRCSFAGCHNGLRSISGIAICPARGRTASCLVHVTARSGKTASRLGAARLLECPGPRGGAMTLASVYSLLVFLDRILSTDHSRAAQLSA